MTKKMLWTVGIGGLLALGSTTAHGDERADKMRYGAPKEKSLVCIGETFSDTGFKAKTPECQAEWERRVQACINDPTEQANSYGGGPVHKDSDCGIRVGSGFETDNQAEVDRRRQARIDKEAKDKKAAEAAATELPKPDQKSPALEKAVTAAYVRGYPGEKVLKVILGPWVSDLEKDGFGRVIGRDLYAGVVVQQADGSCNLHNELYMQNGHGKSFSGPLKLRGAGSAEDHPILCEKAKAK